MLGLEIAKRLILTCVPGVLPLVRTRAVISLAKKEVLGWLLARYRFAIGVVREIDKGEELQCLALIHGA
jgi:hypothetical protein